MPYEKKIPVSLTCGLHLFREVVNGKWKCDLIYYIYIGIKRPGELARQIPKATRRVLDVQLRQLIAHGLISKTIITEKPLKVEYSLTDLGLSLIPLIVTIAQWGTDNQDELEGLILGEEVV